MRDMGGVCPDPEVLGGWIEEGLSPEARAAVSSHLAACDDCRRAVALAATIGLPFAEAAPARRSWRRPALAAGVAAAALLSFWLLRPAPERPIGIVRVDPPKAPLPSQPAPPTPAAPEEVVAVVEEKGPPEPEPPAPPAEVVVEAQRVEDPPPPPAPPPLPERKDPGRTETDLARLFAPVFVGDPTGDLWIRRGAEDPERAGRYEQVSYGDSFVAGAKGAAFTLEGRASVVLEGGAEAAVSFFKPEQAYALNVARGAVTVDTEGVPQKWRITHGRTDLAFPILNGRLSVEPRDGELAALLLEGRGEYVRGPDSGKLPPGREVILAADETLRVGAGLGASERGAGFGRLRPPIVTAFLATFEGQAEEVFPFAISGGRRIEEPSESFLQATPPGAYGGGRLFSCGLSLGQSVTAASGMRLGFRYRTSFPEFVVALGEYSFVFASKMKGREWEEAEVPIERFEQEGVPLVPTDPISAIRFSAMAGKEAGRLDVSRVQLLRRVR